ncbi:MAG TPA: hypothetical protein DCR35_12790 [Runella sp.]|nr:hypothetical protein [Runella sp.]
MNSPKNIKFSAKTFIKLLTAIGYLFTLSAQAQPVNLRKVDSLFLNGKIEETEVLYERYLSGFKNTTLAPLPIYYKLAFINEKQNDYARELYYLSMIYNRQPRQAVLNKITETAANYNLSGYEVDDFSFIFLFFRKYSLYFTLFLLIVGIYAFVVLVQKKRHNELIQRRHTWVVILYLSTLLILLNLPDFYQIGIINKETAFLRESPSSAAPVKKAISRGNKVIVLSETDEWLQIWWDEHALYARKLDVWAIQ